MAETYQLPTSSIPAATADATPAPAVDATPADTPDQATPAEPTLIQQFHPALDPTKNKFEWDAISGKMRVLALEPGEADADPVEDVPETPETPAVAASSAAAPTSELAAMQAEVSNMRQIVLTLVQSQASGTPLAEILGIPKKEAAPDYSQVDTSNPLELAALVRDVVRAEVNAAREQDRPTLEAARRRQEFDFVQATHGADPAFHSKNLAALKLVEKQPSLTIQQAYDIVASLPVSFSATPATPPAATATAPRTITEAQAATKAAQAKKLPGNSGVRGEGRAAPPANIKGLGQLIAWEATQANA